MADTETHDGGRSQDAMGSVEDAEAASAEAAKQRGRQSGNDGGAAASRKRQSDDPASVGGIAADRLRSFIERIERLEEEKKALSNDIKDIYGECKSSGFDVKIIRQLILLRKQEPAEIEEAETLLDVYRRALGM